MAISWEESERLARLPITQEEADDIVEAFGFIPDPFPLDFSFVSMLPAPVAEIRVERQLDATYCMRQCHRRRSLACL